MITSSVREQGRVVMVAKRKAAATEAPLPESFCEGYHDAETVRKMVFRKMPHYGLAYAMPPLVQHPSACA